MSTQITQDQVVSKDLKSDFNTSSKDFKAYLDGYKTENSNHIMNLFESFCAKCSDGNCEIVLIEIKKIKMKKLIKTLIKKFFGGFDMEKTELEEERAKIAVERIKLVKIQLETSIQSLQKSEDFLKELTARMNEELSKVRDDLKNAKMDLKVVLESTMVSKKEMESYPHNVESFKGELLELEEDMDGSNGVTEEDTDITDEEWFEKTSPYNI